MLRAVARYEPGEMPGTTEIAIVVEDGWQHRGLGSLLLDALLAAAERRNLRVFRADVLADNRPMLRVLSRLADIRRRESNHGILTLEFQRRQMREARPGDACETWNRSHRHVLHPWVGQVLRWWPSPWRAVQEAAWRALNN